VRQFDEDVVLEQALALFWRQGYGATSMAELSQATGVQRGSLYNAYGSKEALFLLAYERYAARFEASVRTALAEPDTKTLLQALFEAGIENMTAGSDPRGCLTTRVATEAPTVEAAVRDRVAAFLLRIEALIAEALSRPEHRDRLAVPPEDAARVILTMTRGLAVMQSVHGDAAVLRATASQQVGLLLVDRAEEG
ncbi:MAG: TetR/AcrR family transcriptional regulator, partial [Rhodospirillaceae bacterium]